MSINYEADGQFSNDKMHCDATDRFIEENYILSYICS